MSEDPERTGILPLIATLFGSFFDRLFDSGPSAEGIALRRDHDSTLNESEELLEQKIDMLEDLMDRGIF